MAIAAGVLIALYLSLLVGVFVFGSKSHDPQRGQAEGCALIIGGALVLLGAVLAVGVYFEIPLLVRGAFNVAVFPVVLCAITAVRWVALRLFAR